jgi:hypothetical protein
MAQEVSQIGDVLARWDSGEGKPYKGSLIDWSAYDGDGEAPPTDIGCMCAQGQVLHLLGGWSPRRLNDTEQIEADRETARILTETGEYGVVSIAQAILLRDVNDKVEGAPSIVLTNPEKVLGDQAHIVLAFWRHIDRMTDEQWDAAGATAWTEAWTEAGSAAGFAARAAAASAAWDAAESAAWDVAWEAVRSAAGGAAGYACAEIQGARLLHEQGKPFYFLPMFGFADPEAVLAADQAAA